MRLSEKSVFSTSSELWWMHSSWEVEEGFLMDLEEYGSHDAHPSQKLYKAVRIRCQVLIPDVILHSVQMYIQSWRVGMFRRQGRVRLYGLLHSLMMLEQAKAYSLLLSLRVKAWTEIKVAAVRMWSCSLVHANYVSERELAFPKRDPSHWASARALC